MDIGEVLDIVITYLNTVNDNEAVDARDTTQEDIDNFWG